MDKKNEFIEKIEFELDKKGIYRYLEVKESKNFHGMWINLGEITPPCNPRDYDDIGTIACYYTYKGHNLGDENIPSKEELNDMIKRNEVIYLPLYILEKEGKISIHTVPVEGAEHVGYIYSPIEKIKKEYFYKKMTEDFKNEIKERLHNAVKWYSDSLCGKEYGYEIRVQIRCSKCANREYRRLEAGSGFYDYEEMEKEAYKCAHKYLTIGYGL